MKVSGLPPVFFSSLFVKIFFLLGSLLLGFRMNAQSYKISKHVVVYFLLSDAGTKSKRGNDV